MRAGSIAKLNALLCCSKRDYAPADTVERIGGSVSQGSQENESYY